MRILISAVVLTSSFSLHAAFINPMDFDGSEAQKDEVINYIQDRVKADYCESANDSCNEFTLRSMEKLNLDAFKKLTRAKDRKIMDQVIEDYCTDGPDACNYFTIDSMYNLNLKASKDKLTW